MYQRQTWAQAMAGKGGSVLPGASWLTPNVPNGGRSVSPELVESKGMTEDGQKRTVGLESQTRHWATPDCNTSTYSNGRFGQNLREQTGQWPTPKAITGGANSNREERKAGGPDLQEATKHWPAPRSTDGTKGGPNQHGSRGDLMLPSATAQWPTPAARDYRSEQGGGSDNDAFQPTCGSESASVCSALPLFAPGPTDERWPAIIEQAPWLAPAIAASPEEPEKRRLNPRFVEWLMGWPIGWTEEQDGKAQITSGRDNKERNTEACTACGVARWRGLLQVRLAQQFDAPPPRLFKARGCGGPLCKVPSEPSCDEAAPGELRDLRHRVSAEENEAIAALRETRMPERKWEEECRKAMENRSHRLRFCGNGVVPLAAAAALILLIQRARS